MGWRILVFYPEPEAREHGLADMSLIFQETLFHSPQLEGWMLAISL
jgi:hypothetical protein